MNARIPTSFVAVLAALAAVSGGVFVAGASGHASFASSSAQDGGGFGRFGGPPGAGAPGERP
jgi:hypothetical protein